MQHESVEFDEENVLSPGIRTDTISLLMKIEQLQAQLKYERRCRILAERELRELKGRRETTRVLLDMLKKVSSLCAKDCNQHGFVAAPESGPLSDIFYILTLRYLQDTDKHTFDFVLDQNIILD